MAVTFGAGQAVTSSAAVFIGRIPAGVCDVIISNTTPSGGTAAIAYLGTASGVTATSGWPLPSGATVSFSQRTASAGASLYAIAGSGGSIAVAMITATSG